MESRTQLEKWLALAALGDEAAFLSLIRVTTTRYNDPQLWMKGLRAFCQDESRYPVAEQALDSSPGEWLKKLSSPGPLRVKCFHCGGRGGDSGILMGWCRGEYRCSLRWWEGKLQAQIWNQHHQPATHCFIVQSQHDDGVHVHGSIHSPDGPRPTHVQRFSCSLTPEDLKKKPKCPHCQRGRMPVDLNWA